MHISVRVCVGEDMGEDGRIWVMYVDTVELSVNFLICANVIHRPRAVNRKLVLITKNREGRD